MIETALFNCLLDETVQALKKYTQYCNYDPRDSSERLSCAQRDQKLIRTAQSIGQDEDRPHCGGFAKSAVIVMSQAEEKA